jgi:hypothetical protein
MYNTITTTTTITSWRYCINYNYIMWVESQLHTLKNFQVWYLKFQVIYPNNFTPKRASRSFGHSTTTRTSSTKCPNQIRAKPRTTSTYSPNKLPNQFDKTPEQKNPEPDSGKTPNHFDIFPEQNPEPVSTKLLNKKIPNQFSLFPELSEIDYSTTIIWTTNLYSQSAT